MNAARFTLSCSLLIIASAHCGQSSVGGGDGGSPGIDRPNPIVALDVPIGAFDVPDPQPFDGGPAGECASTTRVIDRSCTVAVIPTRPAGLQNQPSAAARSYAARSIQFGPGGEWRRIGVDRDGLCTVGGVGPSSCRSGLIDVGDGDQGRDNTFSSVLGLSSILTTQLSEARLNRGINAGNATFGIRIVDLSPIPSLARANDAIFGLAWVPLVNGVRSGPAGPNGAMTPEWDGRDRWFINAPNAYNPDRTVAINSDRAFASCGQLVASFAGLSRLHFISDQREPSELRLTNMSVVGHFNADDTLTLDVTGVITQADLLQTIYSFNACPPPRSSAMDWTRLTQALNAGLDVLASGEVSPATPCNAMSIAFRIELVPVQIAGDVNNVPLMPYLCPMG